ncbi:Endoplasmic reticulum-Golgi intermediate compartment protein 2 [Acipenser ruthenus]|uniref:Endoplasmic reticulum-Golgi intermediate compartment protein n=1 Tax=Acipenser ruthenus TaxID=7906 RepID=A0A444U4X6_ACIRT|nr:Endoplasmic reticulum-Golgi intermediate compartment protein 2 [Acipenser ruthenus]
MMRRLNRKKALHLVQELDAFPKVPESYVETTASGGTVSLIAFTTMAVLAILEFFVYQHTWMKYEYEVDKDFSRAIPHPRGHAHLAALISHDRMVHGLVGFLVDIVCCRFKLGTYKPKDVSIILFCEYYFVSVTKHPLVFTTNTPLAIAVSFAKCIAKINI